MCVDTDPEELHSFLFRRPAKYQCNSLIPHTFLEQILMVYWFSVSDEIQSVQFSALDKGTYHEYILPLNKYQFITQFLNYFRI